MHALEEVFERLKKEKRAAFVPYIVAGDPDLSTTADLIEALSDCGADMIELGIPFSDPVADGPTIQFASQRAIRGGSSPGRVFEMVAGLKGSHVPLITMTYYNPLFRFGERRFAENCRIAGIDAVIIPDLPPEEARSWVREARTYGIGTVFMLSPTSTQGRMRLVAKRSSSFIYYVSVTGVTGTRDKIPDELERRIMEVKTLTKKPVVVGFGISTPQQVRYISRFADGIVVGSSLVKVIEKWAGSPDFLTRVRGFIRSMIDALTS